MASNIANGALHLRMNRKETDDIGDLSRAIDLLLDRIAGSLALNEAVLSVNAHCKGTHHVHAKVTHLWGLCARTQSGVLTRGGREA